MSATNIHKIKNYLSMRISIEHYSYRYQYFDGTLDSEALEFYYDNHPEIVPAKKLIANEWNGNRFLSEQSRLNYNEKSYIAMLKGEFQNKVKEYRTLEADILKQYITMMKKSGIDIKITSPERYITKVDDKKRIEIWTKIFNSLSDNKDQEKSPERLAAQMLSLVEIDKKLWSNYSKQISLFSRGYYKNEKKQFDALTKIQSTFKNEDTSIREKAFNNLRKAFETALITATNNSFQNLASKTAQDFTNALSQSNSGNTARSMKELIKNLFDQHSTQFIEEVKKQDNNINIEQINVIIDPEAKNPFLRYEVKNATEYGGLISKQIEKKTDDFYSALILAISQIKTSQKYVYKTIDNKEVFFTDEDKRTVLNYLKSNKKKLINNVILRVIKSNSVITGEIGELQSLLGLPIVGVVRGVKKVGQTNDFMDLIASFKTSEKGWQNYGINIKRFATKYSGKTFQLYEGQNINYNNYKKYFTQKEIKLLNYLKANFEVIQQINDQWNIGAKIPEEKASGVEGYFGNQWRNLLYSHLSDVYRISVPYRGLGVKTNLFFVVNNRYIPVSVIYKELLEQLRTISKIKNSNDVYSNIVGLKEGTKDFKKYRDNRNYDATNLKITKTPTGTKDSFTARFQGFLLDLSELI